MKLNVRDYTTFADCMLAVRRELGMTQVKFAELLDVTFITVYKWEKGMGLPTEGTICRISYLLGLPIREMLDFKVADRKARLRLKHLYYND